MYKEVFEIFLIIPALFFAHKILKFASKELSDHKLTQEQKAMMNHISFDNIKVELPRVMHILHLKMNGIDSDFSIDMTKYQALRKFCEIVLSELNHQTITVDHLFDSKIDIDKNCQNLVESLEEYPKFIKLAKVFDPNYIGNMVYANESAPKSQIGYGLNYHQLIFQNGIIEHIFQRSMHDPEYNLHAEKYVSTFDYQINLLKIQTKREKL